MELTLDSRITDMELSARCRNGLYNGGIKYIRDLKNWSNSDLLKLPNFGRHSLHELHMALRENNFELLDISTFLVHKYVYNKSLLMQMTVNFVKTLEQLLNTETVNPNLQIVNIRLALSTFLKETNIKAEEK
jgi:hypothetical protein